MFATGAGAASRQSLGTAVFGGMITATVLAVFFVPVFYVAIQSLIELRNGPPKPRPGEVIHAPHEAEPPDHDGSDPLSPRHHFHCRSRWYRLRLCPRSRTARMAHRVKRKNPRQGRGRVSQSRLFSHSSSRAGAPRIALRPACDQLLNLDVVAVAAVEDVDAKASN